MQIVNAAGRLDRIPICGWHYKFLGILVAGMIFDIVDLYILGGVMAKLTQIGMMTKDQAATMASANFAGIFLGCVIAGSMIDKYGRKMLYMYNLLIYSIFTILCGLVSDITLLTFFRFLTAFGLGGEMAVGYSLIAEYFPPDKRGRWGVGLSVLNNLGAPLAYMLGAVVLPLNDWSWRIMFMICGIPAFYAWYLRRNFPESPRWLEASGRLEEAERVLSGIEAECKKSLGVSELPPVKEIIVYQHEKLPPTSALLKGKTLTTTLYTSFLFVAGFTLVYGLATWLPMYFLEKGIDVKKSMTYSMIMLFGGPVGVFLSYNIVEYGRKKAIIGTSIAGAIISFFYAQASSLDMILPLGFFTMVCIFAMHCLNQSTYIPELYPTNLRGRGVSLTEGVGRLSTIIAPYFFVWAMKSGGFQVVLNGIYVLFILVVIATVLVGRETANQNLEAVNEGTLGMAKLDRVGDGKNSATS